MALSAAIILAAGEGTRMRSNKPKVLHTLAGKTFLNRVMDSVAALDPDTLAVVVHYQAERVAEAARSYNEHVTIVEQDDIPGTGRAVQCAMAQLTQKDDLDGAVLIAASDMPLLDTDTLDQLLAFHEKSGNGATVLHAQDPAGTLVPVGGIVAWKSGVSIPDGWIACTGTYSAATWPRSRAGSSSSPRC